MPFLQTSCNTTAGYRVLVPKLYDLMSLTLKKRQYFTCSGKWKRLEALTEFGLEKWRVKKI